MDVARENDSKIPECGYACLRLLEKYHPSKKDLRPYLDAIKTLQAGVYPDLSLIPECGDGVEIECIQADDVLEGLRSASDFLIEEVRRDLEAPEIPRRKYSEYGDLCPASL